MDESANAISSFEAILGISFKDPELLKQALTHSSFVNEYEGKAAVRDNERLEFLGDAVIDIVVADMLYRRFPDASEGQLTQLRAALVRTESLAQIGTRFRLGEFLRIGRGEELSGGRQRLTILCQGFEAVVGAIFVDRGLDAVVEFVSPPMLKLLDETISNRLHIDARSELQELTQGRLNTVPTYEVVGAAGPEHDKEFRVEVALGDSVIASGSGGSKRSAAQAAASAALERLEREGFPGSVADAPCES
ncbi:MAG: ribonuclease III [Anaerolineae bacterium]|nr:ribonuclease III [Anaerolineae bacterium]